MTAITATSGRRMTSTSFEPAAVPSAAPVAASRVDGRVQPDTKPVTRSATVLVVVVFTAAFALSFSGQLTVAEWMGAEGYLRLAVPLSIDAMILAAVIAGLVFRSRGESENFSRVVVVGFTVLSMAFNFLHIYVPGYLTGDVNIKTLIGSVASGFMPLTIFIATVLLERLLVAPPLGTSDERRAIQTARDLGEVRIFENPLSRRKGTPERERALLLLKVKLDVGEGVSAIARSESVDRAVIYAAKKEIEASR